MTFRSLVLAAGLSMASLLPAVADDFTLDHVAWIDALNLRPGAPLVTLPAAAGGIVAVTDQRKISRYTQTITLAGDPGISGENFITVAVTRDGLAPRIDQSDIYEEMAAKIPSLPMSMGPPDTTNGFGIFGAAIGTRGTESCLYGWQSVNLADQWLSGHESSAFDEQHSLSIRVRLCRTGVSTAQLLGLMERLAPGRNAGWSGGGYRSRPMRGHDPLSAALSVFGNESQDPVPGPMPVQPLALQNPILLPRHVSMMAPMEAPMMAPMIASPADDEGMMAPSSPRARMPRRAERRRMVRQPPRHRVAREDRPSAAPQPTGPMAGMPSVPLPN
jgi:hypothetical protein